MNYFKKLFNIAVFIFVWVGIPHYFATTYNYIGFYIMMIATWIPASLIFSYLDEDT